MYKSIFAILLVGLLLAGPALADGPPFQDWGLDPTEWDDFGDVGFSEFALYNPLDPGHDGHGCEDWKVFRGGDYVGIPFSALGSIQLWIELYAQMTIANTNIQIHRLGAGMETITIYVGGIFRSNNGQTVCLEACDGYDIGSMMFVEDIFGNDDPQAQPIQVGWMHASGPYDPDVGMPDPVRPPNGYFGGRCVDLDRSDYWIWWRGGFCIYYHQHDGYYLMVLCICPWPWM